MHTASSTPVTTFSRIRYLWSLFLLQINDRPDSSHLVDWESWIELLLEKWGTQKAHNLTFVEIGYGQRPARLIWATGVFKSACGIDLEKPLLSFSLRSIIKIVRLNGVLRGLKTGIRSLFFDRRYYQVLFETFERRFQRLPMLSENVFYVGNANDLEFWRKNNNVDVIYSEAVFEHIPEKEINQICQCMAASLHQDSLAIIDVHIFTGISGGHLPEWYFRSVNDGKSKLSRPWEHLRSANFPADTYLNRFRAADYERIFSHWFEIIEVQKTQYGLGESFLSPSLESELEIYDRDELLTNMMCFIMRPRMLT